MKKILLMILATGCAIGTLYTLHAGSGKSAGIGIGAGVGGFLLGRATAPRGRTVERETVYVQQPTTYVEPARTVTVESPGLRRELRETQDQLATEQNRRLALERELTVVRGKLADTQRDNTRLSERNRELQRELNAAKTEKTDTTKKEPEKTKTGFWY